MLLFLKVVYLSPFSYQHVLANEQDLSFLLFSDKRPLHTYYKNIYVEVVLCIISALFMRVAMYVCWLEGSY